MRLLAGRGSGDLFRRFVVRKILWSWGHCYRETETGPRAGEMLYPRLEEVSRGIAHGLLLKKRRAG